MPAQRGLEKSTMYYRSWAQEQSTLQQRTISVTVQATTKEETMRQEKVGDAESKQNRSASFGARPYQGGGLAGEMFTRQFPMKDICRR
jgi:hypothetical protein